MSRKQLLRPFKTVDAQSVATSFASEESVTHLCDLIQYDIIWAGAGISGNIAIEYSNDDGDTWIPLEFSGNLYIPISGTNGKETILITQQCFNWVRLTYTASSGTGTMDAFITAKSIGA